MKRSEMKFKKPQKSKLRVVRVMMLPVRNMLRLNFCPTCGADLDMPVWMI